MRPIVNEFVLISPDSDTTRAEVPVAKKDPPAVHVIQYELLTKRPYTLTFEELIFATHVRRLGLSQQEAKARRPEIWAELFAKSHACMRCSALPQRYGWGVHYDARGRIALYAVESREYKKFAAGKVKDVKLTPAMRRKK